MNRTALRIAAVMAALLGLGACAAIQDATFFQTDNWKVKALQQNDTAELGLAAMAKGDNVQAMSHFDSALKANPNDVHALYGMALIYQNTGQPNRARQLYEQILAIDPPPPEEILLFADTQTQPILEVARVNLQRLGSGEAPAPGMAPAPVPVPSPVSSPASSLSGAMTPLQPVAAQPLAAAPDAPMFPAADVNIVQRFKALRALLNEGLITQEEFVARRQANVGALLPYTGGPAATGLDRPVPEVGQISGRLAAINRALEMRALSPAQHSAERTMILDALMPLNPASVLNPPAPPHGLMEAADGVRRIELLKQADLITSDEYTKERAAIEHGLQPAAMAPAPKSANGGGASAGGGAAMASGFQPGVHLASFRQQGAAEKGWAELQRRFGALLSGLQPHIERVDLGDSKGVFFRLKAGPLPSNDAAKALCSKLKAQRQYCDPTTVNFG